MEAKSTPRKGAQAKDQPQDPQDHTYGVRKTVSGNKGDEAPSRRDTEEAPESGGGARDWKELRVKRSAGSTRSEEGRTVRKQEEGSEGERKQVASRKQWVHGRRGQEDDDRGEREHQAKTKTEAWMGVGRHTWKMVQNGKRPVLRAEGEVLRRLWVFGDSLMPGVDREIYSLSRGRYKVSDRSKPGANIKVIHKTVEDHLSEFGPEDLVLIEGGGNGLEEIGGQETTRLMEEIVRMVKEKVNRRPLIMSIPMRRDKEGRRFGRERRWVNMRFVEKLEEWGCDGLQLWERMDWRQVWTRDGVHMSNIGSVWMAWNVVVGPALGEDKAGIGKGA